VYFAARSCEALEMALICATMQLYADAIIHPQSGVLVMDDNRCRQFFVEPSQPLHRRYLALRAFFVGGESYEAVAEQFGVTYHTIRSWVRDFRAQCQEGQSPPFSPSHTWAGRSATRQRVANRYKRNSPPRPTVAP
jgi:hypothetical protein